MSPQISEPRSLQRTAGPATGFWQQYLTSFRSFSRDARLFLVAIFLICVNYEVMQLLLGLFLKEKGMPEGEIGSVLASRALGTALIAIPGALLIQKHSSRPMITFGCILFACASAALLWSPTLAALCLSSLTAGIGYGLYRVSQSPFFMRHSDEAERSHLFSSGFAAAVLAGALGSLGAGKLVMICTTLTGDSLIAHRLVMGLAILTGLAALIPISMLTGSDDLTAPPEAVPVTVRRFWTRRREYSRVLISNGLVGLGAGLIIPFLNLYLKVQLGLPTSTIGLLYSVLSFSMVAGALAMPLIVRKLGLVSAVAVVQSASLPFMIALALTVSPWLAVPAFLLRGTFMNMGVPGQHQFAMEQSREEDRQFMNAVLILTLTASWAAGSQIGGLMIEHWGYVAPITLSAILYLGSSILFYRWFHSGTGENR